MRQYVTLILFLAGIISKSKNHTDATAPSTDALIVRDQEVYRAPVPRPTATNEFTFGRRTLNDWIMSDLVLVASLDGTLYALERESGETRWTIESADSAIRSTAAILAANSTQDRTLPSNSDIWMVEPVDDGRLYLFNDAVGLQKLPFGVKQLVEMSPFNIPGDSKVYVGERKTTLFSIDPKNGKVLQAYGSGFNCPVKPPICGAQDDLDQLDEEYILSDPVGNNVLKIGRTVFTLTIFSGSETLWNITYSEWVPNTIDADLKRQYVGPFDGKYVSIFHDGRIISHQTESNSPVWVKQLPSSAVRVYDLLQSRSFDRSAPVVQSSQALAIVPQPLDPHYSEVGHANYIVDSDGKTYIGLTADGDWYALSASKFPLVVTAPPSSWYDGLRSKQREDIAGLHQHNAVSAQQTSGSSLLTIEGDESNFSNRSLEESEGTTKQEGNSKRLLAWFALSVAVFVGSYQYYRKAFDKSIAEYPQIYTNIPQLRFTEQIQASGANLSTPAENGLTPLPIAINSALVPVDDEAGIDDQSLPNGADMPKRRRKRGGRGGKKHRENNGSSGYVELQIVKQVEDLIDAQIKRGTVSHPDVTKVLNGKGPLEPDSSFPLQINSLVVTDKILGYGSHGTIVYKGSFEGRDVAVKRMLLDFYDIASHEVVLLQESDDHPNVIRYYCKQENERFLYIALELCAASLQEVIERSADFSELSDCMKDLISVLQQTAMGVQYLHSLKIVHRDLKPQNILVSLPKKPLTGIAPRNARIVISDFGLCKKLDVDQSSFRATTAQAAGTSGWRAPELLLEDHVDAIQPRESSTAGSLPNPSANGISRKVSRAIDIFSLGCVFYYVLSNGAHPFGDRYMREGNIIRNSYSLHHLDILEDTGLLAKDLISRMILPNAKERPDATNVLLHPFFWTAEKRLAFLLDISDRFEIEERDPPSPLLQSLERKTVEVLGGDWYKRLDRALVENLGRYRKYNGSSILDLLRALRNKKHHYQDLPENVQIALGPVPEAFLGYFTSRFPLLLLHTYSLAKTELAHEHMFRYPYFESI